MVFERQAGVTRKKTYCIMQCTHIGMFRASAIRSTRVAMAAPHFWYPLKKSSSLDVPRTMHSLGQHHTRTSSQKSHTFQGQCVGQVVLLWSDKIEM